MRVSAAGLIRAGGLAAVLAGVLFVAIQMFHPPDDLSSVTTVAWAAVHYISLVMTILFVVGISAIYAHQIDKAGWLGLVGLIVLSLGLLATAAGGVIEIFVLPVLAANEPGFVEGVLGMVGGHPTSYDLGAFTTLWAASGGLFLVGCLLFGVAMFRARVVPRVASAIFALGLPLAAPVVAVTGAYRLAALPLAIGLAWMGYSVWSSRGAQRAEFMPLAAPSAEQTSVA